MRSTALRALVLVGVAAFGAAAVTAQQAAAPPFEAGKHYTVISPAQPTSTDAGKVEVAEVFMFGCPACFSFEPHIQGWLERQGRLHQLRADPCAVGSHPESPIARARLLHGRSARQARGDRPAPSSNEFHTNRNMLDTEAKLAAFFAKHGVDEATFKSTFNSFAVNAKVKRADELVRRYRVQSTPTIIVNGKYATGGPMAGSYERLVRDHRRSRGSRARGGRRRFVGAVTFERKSRFCDAREQARARCPDLSSLIGLAPAPCHRRRER